MRTTQSLNFFNGVCLAGNMLIGILMTANQSLYYEICVELGLPLELWTGILHASMFGGMIISCLVVGELCEHFGKKKIMVASSFLLALGSILLFVSSSIIPIIIGFLLAGCGFGVVDGQTIGLLMDENGERATRMVNFNCAIFSFGAVLSPIIINSYLGVGGNWRMVYLIGFAIFVLLSLLYSVLRFSFRPQATQKEIVSLQVLKNPIFLFFGVLIMLSCGAEAGSSSWTKGFFVDTHGENIYSTLALSIFWATIGVGRMLSGVFEKYKSAIIVGGAVVGAVGVIGMFLSNNPIMALIFYAVSGFGVASIWPMLFAGGVEVAGKNTGAASGMMMLFTAIGGTIFPIMFGVFEISGIFIITSIMYVLLAILYAILRKRMAKENHGVAR